MNNKPIGVFDSGLGGLTAVRELRKVLPNEDIIYFGDTARVPYGARSVATITKYTQQIVEFLMQHDVKMIISACGTVSSTCGEMLDKELPIPYTGVVTNGSQAAVGATKNNRIGVIGTNATVLSGAYGKVIKQIKNDIIITGKACPMFVPLVENGYIGIDNKVTRLVAQEYLSVIKSSNVDTLILGCTHYPLIADIIGDIMGKDVSLIDVGKETARYAAKLLLEKGMLASGDKTGTDTFYVTDNPTNFTEIAQVFLQTQISSDVKLVDVDKL